MLMAWRQIRFNIISNDGSGQEPIDTDDGSSYLETHHNLLANGGGLKGDFGGHDNYHHHNIYAGAGSAIWADSPTLKGHELKFVNNTVLKAHGGDVYTAETCCANPRYDPSNKTGTAGPGCQVSFNCGHDPHSAGACAPPILGDNTYLLSPRENNGMIQECQLDLPEYQARFGKDMGSVSKLWPSNAELTGQIKALLNISGWDAP